jgi:hypothetical protein
MKQKLISFCLEIVLLGARKVHDLRLMYHRHRNRFGHTCWYSYVMYVKWKLVSVCLNVVSVSAQDRCTVCAKRTIGVEIILDAPDGTPSDVGQAEAHYDPFGDSFNLVQDRCTVCDECTTDMEIALGTPDGTPRKCMSSASLFQSIWR